MTRLKIVEDVPPIDFVMEGVIVSMWAKKFDTYAGLMYSQVLGSQANGFLHNNNIAPSVGFRYNF